MDNSLSHRWGPAPTLIVVGWLAAAAALCWCLLGSHDGPSRLFTAVTSAVFALAALYGTRARPRLVATGSGIVVRGLAGARHYDWAQVQRVRLMQTRRFGRDLPTLEVDVRTGPEPGADERLLVFGTLDLGTDPRDVADALGTYRPIG